MFDDMNRNLKVDVTKILSLGIIKAINYNEEKNPDGTCKVLLIANSIVLPRVLINFASVGVKGDLIGGIPDEGTVCVVGYVVGGIPVIISYVAYNLDEYRKKNILDELECGEKVIRSSSGARIKLLKNGKVSIWSGLSANKRQQVEEEIYAEINLNQECVEVKYNSDKGSVIRIEKDGDIEIKTEANIRIDGKQLMLNDGDKKVSRVGDRVRLDAGTIQVTGVVTSPGAPMSSSNVTPVFGVICEGAPTVLA